LTNLKVSDQVEQTQQSENEANTDNQVPKLKELPEIAWKENYDNGERIYIDSDRKKQEIKEEREIRISQKKKYLKQ